MPLPPRRQLVQYQWPTWLHKQTNKQRIIWGYKILFLDVMFPLHLRKIIYIDADQVVNADVAELWDMKMSRHAAIAMTPFCNKDANQHTTGFRFFAQGYWRDHLRGRPYHISALFVVDLFKLRRRACECSERPAIAAHPRLLILAAQCHPYAPSSFPSQTGQPPPAPASPR